MSSFVTVTKLHELLQTRDPAYSILVDVRSYGAFSMGHIPKAQNIPQAELPYHLSRLKKYRSVYLYGFDDQDIRVCQTILGGLGYNSSIPLLGGWRQRNQQIGIIEKQEKKFSAFQQTSLLLVSLSILGALGGYYFHDLIWYTTGLLLIISALRVTLGEKSFRHFLGNLPRNKPKNIKEQSIFRDSEKRIGIKQFSHSSPTHLSYAVRSDHEMIIVDPDRDISQYTDFAGAQRARISGIFLTHTHSDFVGGHSALAKHTGAPILAHPGMPSSFASQEIKEGNLIYCGEARIFVLETPGHTEDSLSFCIQNQTGKTFAILVGDTFDISHFHQPQPVNSIQDDILTKESRCHRMYRSIQDKIMKHNTRTLLFPAHTVMGMKVFSVADQLYGHQGIAKLQLDSFSQLLDSHGQDVRKHRYTGIQLNSNELCTIPEQLARIPFFYDYHKLPKDKLVVDCRKSLDRATYYITESVNIPLDDHFVESLGSIVGHNEQWYAIAQNEQQARLLVAQAATIGYDQGLLGILLIDEQGARHLKQDYHHIRAHKDAYLVLDIRSHHDRNTENSIPNSVHIPLADIRNRNINLPQGKHICLFSHSPSHMHTAYSILKQRFPHLNIVIADDITLDLLR